MHRKILIHTDRIYKERVEGPANINQYPVDRKKSYQKIIGKVLLQATILTKFRIKVPCELDS